MKRYLKEIIILLLQLFVFYIFPLFAGPTDVIGMVVFIIFVTLLLSVVIGLISDKKMKYLYPIITAILFVPSVFIYYNETALIHSVWYLVVFCRNNGIQNGCADETISGTGRESI